jgi:hypothetical protein
VKIRVGGALSLLHVQFVVLRRLVLARWPKKRGQEISVTNPVELIAYASLVDKLRVNFSSWCPEGIDELLHDKETAIAVCLRGSRGLHVDPT